MQKIIILLLLLSVPLCALAGTYQCSISESEAGYVDADFARNPAFLQRKDYIQNQLDTALAALQQNQDAAAAYRAKIVAKVQEPSSVAVSCNVSAANETLLDQVMLALSKRQDKVNLLLFNRLAQVRNAVQRPQKQQLLEDANTCIDGGKVYTLSRDKGTQVLQGACQ